jgi:hypothetical protein
MRRLSFAPLVLGVTALLAACSAPVKSPTSTTTPVNDAALSSAYDPANSPLCVAARNKVGQLQGQARYLPSPSSTATGLASIAAEMPYTNEINNLLQTAANLVLENRECFSAVDIVNAEAALGG